MKKLKAPRIHPMARVNTRIEVTQQRYIKALAKSSNRTEGEVFRAIIADYIESKKHKNR